MLDIVPTAEAPSWSLEASAVDLFAPLYRAVGALARDLALRPEGDGPPEESAPPEGGSASGAAPPEPPAGRRGGKGARGR